MTTPVEPGDAAAWAVRTADPAFDDWAGFEAWLADDPANAARYDAVVCAVEDAATAVATLPPAPAAMPGSAVRPPRRAVLRWAGGGIAAALVATLGVQLWTDRAQPYAIATAAGEQRTVPLVDGSEIVVAGGSRVVLDHAAPRLAVLETGTALFRVRHDAEAPFVVRAAGVEMVDLGTVFDVTHDAGVTRVAVGEGEVMVDPDGAAVRLVPGQAARVEAGRVRRQQVVAGDVGRWRDGVLTFDDATIGEVAAALSRTLARPVVAPPAVAPLRFQGTIDTARVANDPELLGRLLGVGVVRTGPGWRLEPPR